MQITISVYMSRLKEDRLLQLLKGQFTILTFLGKPMRS